MKTLAEWKARLQPGAQIRQIWNWRNGDVRDAAFTVTRVQTNGVWGTKPGVERRLWLEFPKRAEIEFTDNGWRRLEGGRKIAEYVWVGEVSGGQDVRMTPTRRQKDPRTRGQVDGHAYANEHQHLDDGQRKLGAEWYANAKRFRGQAWQEYYEGFIEGAEAEEAARKGVAMQTHECARGSEPKRPVQNKPLLALAKASRGGAGERGRGCDDDSRQNGREQGMEQGVSPVAVIFGGHEGSKDAYTLCYSCWDGEDDEEALPVYAGQNIANPFCNVCGKDVRDQSQELVDRTRAYFTSVEAIFWEELR